MPAPFPSSALILGLTAAFGWGIGDFLSRGASREVGYFRSMFYFQFAGLLALSLFLGLRGDLATPWPREAAAWGWMALACLLNVIAGLTIYRAFSIGTLAIVSPISASYGGLTGILAFFSGERIGLVRGAALIAVVVGLALASAAPSPPAVPGAPKERYRLPPGVGSAIIASLVFGFLFWLLGFHVTPKFGGTKPIWLFRVTSPILLFALAKIQRADLSLPPLRSWRYLAPTGLLDTLAFTAVTIGLAGGETTLVTVLSSLFSAVTVVIAWVILREPMAKRQWLGVAMILAAIAAAQLASS